MSGYDGARVLEAIRAINAAQSTQEIIDVTLQFALPYGFTKLLVGQLVSPASVPFQDILYVTNWPRELTKERVSSFAIHHDPVANCALKSTRPFRWKEAIQYATRQGRKVVQMTGNYGINDGYMFPVHGLYSIPGGVSLGGDDLELSPTELRELELVAQTIYVRLEEMEGPFPYQDIADLSDRECEVVQFVAAGKTNPEIATILGIQEDTVKKTIQRASQKLNTTNRAHTVAQAIAKRQIFG